MGKKETNVGGKRLPHTKGYIDKGLLYKGQVYPLFSDKQNGKSWNLLNSIKSKNISKKDLDKLKASLKEAGNDREREEAYIAFNKARGISEEVSVKALELSNNRDTEKFIKGSTDEFQDFNKVIRGKVTIKVDKGDQKTAPKVEEVSGQGLPKSKAKPKIEEPDDDIKSLLTKKGLSYDEAEKKFKQYYDGLIDFDTDEGGVRGTNKIILYKKIWGQEPTKEFSDIDKIISFFQKEMIKSIRQGKQKFLKDKDGDLIPPPPPVDSKGRQKPSKEFLEEKERLRKLQDKKEDEKQEEKEDEKKEENITMDIQEKPKAPAPPEPEAKQGESADEVKEQIQERLMEQEGTAGYSPTTNDEATGLDLDSEEDSGMHNEAIQRIATMNDYDFSFTKKSLLSVNPLPDDKNSLRKMGEKCLREYGFLLGVAEPKDNFSKAEVEELYTLKHILKQVIRLEAQYKRALLKMRVSVSGGSNQLDKLMSEGQLGLVLNAGSLNISPQQAVEQSSTSPVLQSKVEPQEAKQGIDLKEKPQKPEIDIFEEMGLKKKGKKKKKKGRLNMEYKDRRKAMLREPRNIVFKGRINATPQFQNLRSEAERLNENPIPLVFKSNPNLNRMRRFSTGY